MAKTKRPPVDEIDDEDSNAASPPQLPPARQVAARPARRSRFGWFMPRLVVMLVVLGGLVWFAPTIIASTSLWKSLLASAAPQFKGKIDARSLSLGWLSPIVVSDVAILGADGQPLAQIAKVSSSKTLLDLIRNHRDLGKFTIADPTLVIVMRASGSNVEDLLAEMPKDDFQGSATQPISLELEVTGGQIALDDQASGKSWHLEQLSSRIVWPAVGRRQGDLSAAVRDAAAAPGPAHAGDVTADFSWQPAEPPSAAGAADLGSGLVHATLRGFPTEALSPLLLRTGFDVEPTGPLSTELAANWAAGGQTAELELRQLSAPNWAVFAPEYLGDDRLQLAIASGRGQISLDHGRLTVRELQIESDLMQISGKGSAAIEQWLPAAMAPSPPLSNSAAPTSDDLQLSGRLDLPRLAAQLPGTLRLRADTRITSGTVIWSLGSTASGAGRKWETSLEADNLAAETAGRRIAWQQPVTLAASVTQAPTGWMIEHLRGAARFMKLEGRGALADGSITASADLNQLVADLSEVVDWQGLQMKGTLSAELNWRQDANNVWQAAADASVKQFQLDAPNRLPWRESNLQLSARLNGQLSGNVLQSLTSGNASVVSGGDRLDAELTAEVANPSATTVWPIRYVVQGQLATWMPRLQAVAPAASFPAEGALQWQGAGRFSPQLVQLEANTIAVDNLQAQVAGLNIREPRLQVETAGTLDLAKSQLDLPSSTVACTAIALRADKLAVDFSTATPAVSGLIEYRGDLERISSWLVAVGTQQTWRFGGALTGAVEARVQQGVVTANVRTDIDELTYATLAPAPRSPIATAANSAAGWTTHWVEPKVNVSANGVYDPARDGVQLTSAECNSSAVRLAAAGAVTELSGRMLTDIQGQVIYNGASIAEKLRPMLGDTLQITGNEQRKFALRGPMRSPASVSPGAAAGLISNELTGQAAIAWQEVKFVGLTAGAAETPALLERGIVTLGPLNIPVSEGRITATPRLVLNEPQPLLTLGQGQVIDHVRLSPEICHTWLKYVAPLVADATQAEGKFSMSLRGANVPLTQPDKTSVAGALTIHQAEIGPGPLAQQYLVMAQQIRALIDRNPNAKPLLDSSKPVVSLPEQNIDFEVIEGRVHHQGLKMTVRDVVITTHGSVGFDQTIDLVADIPIQDSWIAQNAILNGLRGKSISVPIRGDLTKPRPDSKAIEDFGRNFLRSAAQGVVEDQLNKGLQRLFGPLQGKPPGTP